MVDISPLLGLSAKFDGRKCIIKYGKDVNRGKDWTKTLSANSMSGDFLWKSLRFGQKYTDENGDVIKEPNLNLLGGKDKVIYSGQQGPYWNDKKLNDLLARNKIRPDVTILPAGDIEGEYNRTEGHYHKALLPEVYQTVCGKNGFLLFKRVNENSDDIEDVMFILADEGDIVVFPPRYHHISINLGTKPFVMTDFVSTLADSDFSFIKKHNGAPYWVMKEGKGYTFEKNPRYKGKVPDVRVVKPVTKIPTLGLEKGKPIFDIVKYGKIEKLAFLNEQRDRPEYKKAYIPYTSE